MPAIDTFQPLRCASNQTGPLCGGCPIVDHRQPCSQGHTCVISIASTNDRWQVLLYMLTALCCGDRCCKCGRCLLPYGTARLLRHGKIHCDFALSWYAHQCMPIVVGCYSLPLLHMRVASKSKTASIRWLAPVHSVPNGVLFLGREKVVRNRQHPTSRL